MRYFVTVELTEATLFDRSGSVVAGVALVAVLYARATVTMPPPFALSDTFSVTVVRLLPAAERSPRLQVIVGGAARRAGAEQVPWVGMALNLKEARARFVEAREYALAHGLPNDARDCEVSLAQLDVIEGRVEAGLAFIQETTDSARVDRAESLAVGPTATSPSLPCARSTTDRQRFASRTGLRYADEIEQSFCGHMMASTEAIVSWGEGQWAVGVEQGGQALSDPGSDRARATALWALGYIAAGRGDRAAAEAQLTSALEFGRRSGLLDLTLPPQWGLAEAAVMAGDASRAIALCEDALTTARQRGEWGLLAPFVMTGVRAFETAGRPDAATKWLDQIVRAIGPLSDVAAPAIRHGTGLVSLAHGSIAAAREALADAVRLWDERGRRWEAL